MSQTRTAVTEHGSVEYEVTECDSCGQKVATDDTSDVIIADTISKEREYTSPKYNINDVSTKGIICEYCENGENFSGLNSDTNDSDNVGRSFQNLFKHILSVIVTITLLPSDPLRQELKDHGMDDSSVNFVTSMVTTFWAFALISLLIIGIAFLV